MQLNLISDLQFKRNDDLFLATKMDQEMVIMDKSNGQFLGLNIVGSDIWEILAQPCTIKSLVEQLMTLYDISIEQCTNEVIVFIEKLREHNMLHIL